MRKFQITNTGRGNVDKQVKHRKDENPEAVSQNYWREQRSEKNEEEPFTRIKAGHREKFLLKAEKEHQNRKLFFR